LWGGSEIDATSYSGADASVVASLANATGEAAGDTYDSIENLIGSIYGDGLNGNGFDNTVRGGSGEDTIKGYAGQDRLYGDADADTLIGGSGADDLVGGAGSDTASYLGATAAVTANLTDPGLNKGDAAGDTSGNRRNGKGQRSAAGQRV
jgi:Ca2+-binding RTX toxin-like protein